MERSRKYAFAPKVANITRVAQGLLIIIIIIIIVAFLLAHFLARIVIQMRCTTITPVTGQTHSALNEQLSQGHATI